MAASSGEVLGSNGLDMHVDWSRLPTLTIGLPDNRLFGPPSGSYGHPGSLVEDTD